jgi:predicted glycosyltransferase involved in capsule biosynthesis
MLLSILLQGKNDKYGCDVNGRGGVDQRLKISLNKLCDNLHRLNNPKIEVILCDWGSDTKIVDSILENRHINFKCVYVPQNIGKKYSKQSDYSIAHAYNVSFQRSSGEYVIFWDSDCFITYENFARLVDFTQNLSIQNNHDTFFWGSRYHLPRPSYNDARSFLDTDQFISNNNLSSFRHDKINITNFDGRAMSLLMSRKIGQDSTCWWEELPYWGWQDIELHIRLSQKYKFGGDLEDNQIMFFHLDHHDAGKDYRSIMNPYGIMPQFFNANDNFWGLMNENLEFV